MRRSVRAIRGRIDGLACHQSYKTLPADDSPSLSGRDACVVPPTAHPMELVP